MKYFCYLTISSPELFLKDMSEFLFGQYFDLKYILLKEINNYYL